MTDRTNIFRREALEFQAGVREHGAGRAVDRPRSGWLYWLVLALTVAGVGVAFTLRTDETTSGPAFIDPQARTFVALVPDAAASDLQRGHAVRLELGGRTGRTLAGEVQTIEVTDAAGAQRAGFASSAQPSMLVTGALAATADTAGLPASRRAGQAVVILGSGRLLDLLFSGFGDLFGTGRNS
jgi:hypothetical protein